MPFTPETRGKGSSAAPHFNDKQIPPLMPVVDCTELIQAIYMQLFNDYISAVKARRANKTGFIRNAPSCDALLKEAATSLITLNRIFFDNENAELYTLAMLKELNKGHYPAGGFKNRSNNHRAVRKENYD